MYRLFSQITTKYKFLFFIFSAVIWTEAVHVDNHYVVYKMDASEKISAVFDPLQHQNSRRKRDGRCNCPMTMYVGKALAVDHSQDDKMEILVYDITNDVILATDLNGCQCRTVIKGDQITSAGKWNYLV